MTSKALPPLFVEVPGPRRDRFLCVISGNRLSLGSNHCITASKLQNSALCVVAPANDLSERPAHLLRADPATNELFGLLSANLSIKQHFSTRLTLCFRLLVILLSSDLHHLVVADHLGLVDHLGVVYLEHRQDKIRSLAVSKAN